MSEDFETPPDFLTLSDIETTKAFFERVFPEPVVKNFHTQLGVHFEEVAEFVASLKGTDRVTQAMLTQVLVSTHALALHLKASDEVLEIADRVECLDGLCDQIVTAVGVAHMASLDIVGGFREVNRANFSKFDDNGLPIFDNNRKMIKGPRYSKPDLEKFV